jgi:methionyl-tRNA formyltransferase/SAM-dependent methyltransferase
MITKRDETGSVKNKMMTWLRRSLARRVDPVAYWEERAKRLRKHAVLNIRHQGSDLEEMTNKHWEFYDTALAANVPIRAGQALDYGCGAGRFTQKLLAYADRAVGVDISSTLISLTTPHDCVEFRVVQPILLPFPDAHFDIVFVNLVFGGILDAGDLAAAALELQRVLKPGGFLLIAENTTLVRDVSHWRYRSAEHYIQLFEFIHLSVVSSYLDAGETISVLVGHKNAPRMRIQAVFFCGDASPYGLAHLSPIQRTFDLRAVIVANRARWRYFLHRLNGDEGDGAKVPFLENIALQARQSLRWSSRRRRLRRLLAAEKTEVIEVYDVNDDNFVRYVGSKFAECIFLSAAYPQIFSARLLTALRNNAINFHPSLLPAFRGAHPHFWAIAKGAQEGGLSAHYMTEQLDAGDIVAQISFPIRCYYYSQLYEKLIQETPSFVRSVGQFLESGSEVPTKQESARASTYRNERTIHCRIFWASMTADQIQDLVRTERAFCFFRDKRVRIARALIEHSNRNTTNNLLVESGTIVEVSSKEIVVACVDGAFLRIAEWTNKRWESGFIEHYGPLIGEKLS